VEASASAGTGIYGSGPRKKRCRYDDQCFRENALHFAQFSHPKREAKLAYKSALTSRLQKNTKLSRTEIKELNALRVTNGVSDEDHEEYLKTLGWSLEEFAMGWKESQESSSGARKRKHE